MREEDGMLTPDGREIAKDTFRALFDVLEQMCDEQEANYQREQKENNGKQPV